MSEKISNSVKKIKLSELRLPQDLKKLSVLQTADLCCRIRRLLIDTVSKTGGHLASNLGTVELSVVLHKVFDSPQDKILWDVGHQAYTHKLLTGRLDRFSTLRQKDGISGFPKPCESEHDAFISGHSSNSISAALGIAAGMKLKGDTHHAVAVIGDGALTGGLAYEGLNNAGKSDTNIIIVLNDNEMSISKSVGALAKYLSKLRTKQSYKDTKTAVEKILDKTPVLGQPVKRVIKSSKKALKNVLFNSTMFEDFGFEFIGPVDGHSITELQKAFLSAKSMSCPVFIHVNTIKGKGYPPAESNPGEFHGVGSFEIETGNPDVVSCDSFSCEWGKELSRLADEDGKIAAITAAMKYGTGLQFFSKNHRERFYDVGIAEQHAVTFSAGLSKSGMLPVFSVYSSFLQRAYDQLLHDASIDNTHIVLGIDRAGIVGEDGETHQGLFDVSFLATIPNVTLYSPSCYEEMRICLKKALYDDGGIVGVRYPRGGESPNAAEAACSAEYTYNKNGESILLITYGRIYFELLKAVNALSEKGYSCSVLKLVKIFPIDKKIINLALEYKNIFFFEEGEKSGSIAQKLSSILYDNGFRGKLVIRATEGFVKQATVCEALEMCGLDSVSMADTIIAECENEGKN
ncbi:MAG: 1-deoxy-D-xylulose-5-phosphate synthase [Oscillospiraceae bacterium]|jgi:1-deoxy-D-xylulose-5-phosphate synthase